MTLFNEKTKLTALVATLVTPLTGFIEKYLFADWQFVAFLIILIGLDTVLSLAVHWRGKSISSSGFAKIFIKLIIYMALLILTHVLTHFTVKGQTMIAFAWVDYTIYSIIMAREAVSIVEKIGDLDPELLPPWLLDRLKKFQKQDPDNQ